MLTFTAAFHTHIQSSIESGICWLSLLPSMHRYSPALSQGYVDFHYCLVCTDTVQHWVRDMLTFTTAFHTHIQSSIESGICWLSLLPSMHRYSPALSQGYVDFHCCLSYTHTVQHWVRDMLTFTAAFHTHIQSSIESGICWLSLLPSMHRYSPALSQGYVDFHYCLVYTDTDQHWVRDMLTFITAFHTQIQSSIESGICWLSLLPFIHTYSPALSQGYVDFHYCLVCTDTVQHWVRDMLTFTTA